MKYMPEGINLLFYQRQIRKQERIYFLIVLSTLKTSQELCFPVFSIESFFCVASVSLLPYLLC